MLDTNSQAPAGDEAAGPLTVKLSKAIPVFDETRDRLIFRDPTAADIFKIGNPVHFDVVSDPPKISHDERKMTAMIATLADIPSSSVTLMTTRDWLACAWAISPFFVPALGTI